MKNKNKINIWLLLGLLAFLLFWIASNILSALNQSVAMTRVGQIIRAEKQFRKEQGKYGSLQEIWKAGLIPIDLSSNSESGFRYKATFDEQSFMILAEPLIYPHLIYGGTGRFSICLDENAEPCADTRK